MANFVGRNEELAILGALLKKKSASLVVIKGRRRIGKSRLVEELAARHPSAAFYVFSGLVPQPDTTAQSERDEFASQLHSQTGLPEIKADDWNKLFLLLAEKVKKGKVIILFDEISWMGSKDPDFLGKLKNIWDWHFKKNDQLILVLCGSISTWIEENILSSSGFVGRISIDLTLKELPLYDCEKFWGQQEKNVSAYEKFKVLAVTGGIPLYLEHINPAVSAEENIKQLCFLPHGLLFDEFENIFSDLFSKRSKKYKEIIRCLVSQARTQEDICEFIGLERSGDISGYLGDLIQAGFITRDYTWKIKDKVASNLSRYRLSDNYSRFYLKYISPNRNNIENNKFSSISLHNLPGWSALTGLTFENLVLNNRRLLWRLLKLHPDEIIHDNPYFQRKTVRHAGCQIDYLIQLKYNTLYICEIKFSKDEIKKDIIPEMQRKIASLSIPKHFSYRVVLIHVNGVKEEVAESGFFSNIVDFGQFFKNDIDS